MCSTSGDFHLVFSHTIKKMDIGGPNKRRRLETDLEDNGLPSFFESFGPYSMNIQQHQSLQTQLYLRFTDFEHAAGGVLPFPTGTHSTQAQTAPGLLTEDNRDEYPSNTAVQETALCNFWPPLPERLGHSTGSHAACVLDLHDVCFGRVSGALK